MKRIGLVAAVRSVTALVTAAVVMLTGGCVVEGNPVADYPDPAPLNVGKYSIDPLDQPSGSEKYGRVVEAARLAETLIDPIQVDATLTHAASPQGVLLLPTPAKATLLLAEPVRAVLEQNGMLTGCAASGTDSEPAVDGPQIGAAKVLSVIVLRFPDESAAQRAAADIDVVDAAVSPGNVSVLIPGYAAAHAHWRPDVPTMATTIADGANVVSLLIGDLVADQDTLTGMARKTFDAQLPRIREFVPTARDRLSTMPLDRDGMLSRMVPEAPGRWPYPVVTVGNPGRVAQWSPLVFSAGVVFGPRAAQLVNGRRLVDSGIELRAVNGWTELGRFATVAAARRFFDGYLRSHTPEKGYRYVDGPAGVPDVSCDEDVSPEAMEETRYSCRVLHGRYVGATVSRDLNTLRQRIAAQYGLLATSG
ncbi:hypothetical protein JMUB6875_29540 [Nocardia sp. JMUB6875]|uniref:DUF7373 family lipoprotein n=1 Tax=Nocardia sp. JMUB6875 TaxID=3158170 RepID=UPI0032E71E00